MSTMLDLKHLFDPQSVAVVGVSADYHKVGHIVARNILSQGYEKDLYLINPKGGSLLGRNVNKSLEEIPHKLDTVVFAVPADKTLDLIERYSDKFKTAVILSAGFKELGDLANAKSNESRLQKIIQNQNINVLGPNCAGYVNTSANINATFLPGPVPKGGIALITQSGAIGSVFIDYLSTRSDAGISALVSLGNKSHITESEALVHLADDKNTRVIAMYLEDVKNGVEFAKQLKSSSKHKPVVVFKSGSSIKGKKAAISHTGSLAGDDKVFSAVIAHCGAMRANSLDELITICEIYEHGLEPKNSQMIVITNAGGGGVIASDVIDKNNLSFANWDIGDVCQVAQNKADNPLDLRGDANSQKFVTAIENTRDDPSGGVVVIVTPQANTQIEDTAKAICALSPTLPHPIYPVFLGGMARVQATGILNHSGLPCFGSIEILIRSLNKCVARMRCLSLLSEKLPIADDTSALSTASYQSLHTLSLGKSLEIIKSLGVDVIDTISISTHDELRSKMINFIYPVVAKISTEKQTHKTDVGGVKMDICSFEELEKYYLLCLSGGYSDIVIQRQIRGLEFIIGAKRDKDFGIVGIFGLGGILTEHIDEVITVVDPISIDSFTKLVLASQLRLFVTGFRGFKPIDLSNLFSILIKMCDILSKDSNIYEVELNPMILTRDGERLLTVDARVVRR
jgi:acetate---CoA ligase (ADP-forming)